MRRPTQEESGEVTMAIRLLIGAFVAAIVMFVWGWVFWALLAVKLGEMQQADKEVIDAMIKHTPELESGEYFYPMPPGPGASEDDTKNFVQKHNEGPLVEISYQKGGTDPMDPLYFAIGFAYFVALGVIAGFLLIMALKSLPTYLGRVGFVMLLGIFATAAIDVASVVWFHHPWRFAATLAIYHASTWLLAGLVLGAIIRPPRTA
jgi:hypothetical protein